MKTTNRREAILSKTEYDIMSIIWDINRSASAREIYEQAKIGKGEYVRKAMHDVKKTFFGGNLRSMLSFFICEEELSEEELINFLHEMESELTENS